MFGFAKKLQHMMHRNCKDSNLPKTSRLEALFFLVWWASGISEAIQKHLQYWSLCFTLIFKISSHPRTTVLAMFAAASEFVVKHASGAVECDI